MPASIVFLEDGAVISAEVDSPSAHANTPLRKCVNALLTYCPQGFHSKVERGNKSQGVIMEVTVCASLVDEIPLLSDIRSSTQASKKRRETGDDSEKRNSFDPPCSIVGLFSVLLLHEQLVTVDGWLGDSSHPEKCLEDPMLEDPMLALETLQVRVRQHMARHPVASLPVFQFVCCCCVVRSCEEAHVETSSQPMQGAVATLRCITIAKRCCGTPFQTMYSYQHMWLGLTPSCCVL